MNPGNTVLMPMGNTADVDAGSSVPVAGACASASATITGT